MNLVVAVNIIIIIIGMSVGFFSGTFALIRTPKEILSRIFVAGVFTFSFFNLIYVIAMLDPSRSNQMLYIQIANFLWFVGMALAFHFLLLLAKVDFVKNPWTVLLIYIPVPIMSVISLTTNWFYSGVELTVYGTFSPVIGQLYGVLFLYTTAYFALQFIFCVLAMKRLKKVRERKLSFFMLLGLTISFFIGVIVVLILPLAFKLQIPAPITLPTTIYILFFTVAMLRFGLFVVTPALVAEDIINTMPDYLAVTDESGNILMANKRFLEFSGFLTMRELIDMPLYTIIAKEKSTILAEELSEVYTGKNILKGFLTELMNKKGDRLSVRLNACLAKDRFGQELGCIMVFHDISEEKKLLADKEQIIGQLEKAKEDVSRMLEDARKSKGEADEKSEQIKKLNVDLKDKLGELEIFHNVASGREIKMISLEKEVNDLLKTLGKSPKYKEI
ncbi:MAG: PAS domain S-box protein [Candidatus Margulisbacteria bacterium]|nr:PAS domain S-box protein [Candidatus Margulisiibacteriota bacterium]